MHFNEENYIICKYVISYIINKEITLASSACNGLFGETERIGKLGRVLKADQGKSDGVLSWG